jgi:hypothetical protein
MSETQRDRLVNAIGGFLARLESYPGWKEWKRRYLAVTLYFDEMSQLSLDKVDDEFRFSDEIEKQRLVVVKYLWLSETIRSLKECEFYFRRYPFRGLPVTRYDHITNVCEMYFGRFYEFKERLKKYFDALGALTPEHHLEFGTFIKLFAKVFDQELRARNRVHHLGRFEDIAIDKILLTSSFSENHGEKGWKREHLTAYRKVANEWAERVRRRGDKMDEFLEEIARVTLDHCSFLSVHSTVPTMP